MVRLSNSKAIEDISDLLSNNLVYVNLLGAII
jgi:hypothetical protein